MVGNMIELATLLQTKSSDVFIQLDEFNPGHTTLSIRANDELLVVEHTEGHGYGISTIASEPEGWMRGCELFTSSFYEAQEFVLHWLEVMKNSP